MQSIQTAADYYKAHELDPYIETASGKKFFIEHPEFDIDDITHALSNQCRYTGHSSKFYSVAEHSVLVSRIMRLLDLGDPFEGLMHDAAEAYLSDIAAPWKALLPDYKLLEAKIEVPLRRHFTLPETITSGCKRADWIALFVEARELVPSKAVDWIAPGDIKEVAASIKLPIWGFQPAYARRIFMDEFHELQVERRRAAP